jgi:hypothetical protein
MLYSGKDKVERLYIGRRAVRALYRGAVKVWEAVSSCFGSGWWRGDKPWRGGDVWKY